MKKTKIFLIVVGVLLAVAALVVFVVLPDHFAPTEEEGKALVEFDVDSLMNVDVPAEPDVDVPAEPDIDVASADSL